VITFHSEEPSGKDAARIDNVPVTYLPWIGRGLRQWPRRHDLLIRAVANAEVVHCYGLYNLICPVAVQEAVKQSKPVVIEPLGMYPPRARNQLAKRIYNTSLTKWVVRRSQAVIAASEAEAADLEKIVDKNKIHYRRNGIDVASFAKLPSGEKLRERWRIAEEEKLVLFIGRLSPIKNLEGLIRAFALSNLATARLVLVGPSEPEYEKTLRRQVEELDLGDRVVFAGALYEDEQKAALDAADLFVLPSLNESFGNAAGEAVAANVPVLLAETCGIAPLIHRRAGLAVPLGVESLADGIEKMLDPGFRDQMTARREEVKRELSWDEPIAETESLYRNIIAGRE
jgi:glycosyltransferase involved in cell wall biosynthesis